MDNIRVHPGTPYPLGATWNGEGVNFTLFALHAEKVELCLFDDADSSSPTQRIILPERAHGIFHVYIPGLKPGQLYGYRVHGLYDPSNGHRYNSNKLLIDPYTKALAGPLIWNDALFGYEIGHEQEDMSFSESDSAPFISKCVVTAPNFDWEGDAPVRTPYQESVIYELHVKGFTKLNTEIPEELRGTYAGLTHPAAINHFKRLGITAVELLPVHAFVSDRHLVDKGLCNYWGYNSIGFFAPDSRYSSTGDTGEQVIEFKNMVKALHRERIEVILDVVFNHTAEGNHFGPTLSFRGIDNAGYYRLEGDKRYYTDYTGTGNTLNARLPNVLKLIMDSLRYWITEMHVDGFRFDLASALARELHEVNQLSAFFDIIYQDPIISQVKLIAEPWDVGEGGYQVGNFPPGWGEWNGMYRDVMRDYWRGTDRMLPEFAQRFTGSADLYQSSYRTPSASINFITAHDGFTLHDLVSYNEKHNEANLDNNNDGEWENRSINWGVEGPTDDETILGNRLRHKRNLLTTLLLSQGVPMLFAGDEMGHTKNGNNNSYCQDNEISWIDWAKTDKELFDFTSKLIQFKRAHPVFCRRHWFQGGQAIHGDGTSDIAWFHPNGHEMEDEHWQTTSAKSLAVYLNGDGLHYFDWRGDRVKDDSFYIIFNGDIEPVDYVLPPEKYGRSWNLVANTSTGAFQQEEGDYKPGETIRVDGHCILLLTHPYD